MERHGHYHRYQRYNRRRRRQRQYHYHRHHWYNHVATFNENLSSSFQKVQQFFRRPEVRKASKIAAIAVAVLVIISVAAALIQGGLNLNLNEYVDNFFGKRWVKLSCKTISSSQVKSVVQKVTFSY